MLALFHLDSPSEFLDHPALVLLDLLLRLFLAWRWVRRAVYWIPGWIVDRSWRILKRPVYHILTGIQANHVWPWFALLLFGCPNERQYSLGISTHPNENSTSWDWCIMNTSVIGLALIKRLGHALRSRSQCRWGCHWDTLLRRRRASRLGSSWCKPETWPVC